VVLANPTLTARELASRSHDDVRKRKRAPTVAHLLTSLAQLVPQHVHSSLLELREHQGVHLRYVHDGPHKPALEHRSTAQDVRQASAARLGQKVDAQGNQRLDGQKDERAYPE